MKKLITLFCFTIIVGLTFAQQASDYFPSQTGFEWKLKAIPLDSVSNPINSLAYYRIDHFESVEDYKGKLANIVLTKSGSLQTILLQPFLDSLFYSTEGTNGFQYFSITNILPYLLQLDSLPINFNFVEFFASLQDWYPVYQFASTINTEYILKQVDTLIFIDPVGNVQIRFTYLGKRLPDQTIPTVLGNFDCKRFLLQWKVTAYSIFDLLTLNDTVWIAPDNWIVQDIIPGQYVDLSIVLPIDPFSLTGLEIKLSDEIVSVKDEETSPDDFVLEQNYPNPFNPVTKIKFTIAQEVRGESQEVTLKVYNILGNQVATLVKTELSAGTYEVIWNADNFPSGIYFYKLTSGNLIETKKMLLLK